MNKAKISLFILLLAPVASHADLMSHKLLAYVAEQQMPSTLYAEKDAPWDYGVYSLTVKKRRGIKLSSTAQKIHLDVPLNLAMQARVRKNIMGFAVKVDCETAFNTSGLIALQPKLQSQKTQLLSSIEIQIPAVQLNCGSFSLPIQAFLQSFVENNKANWQQRIEGEFSQLLKLK